MLLNKIKGRRGASDQATTAIFVVVILVLIGALAPVALTSFFNQNQNGSFTCEVFNDTSGVCIIPTSVPGWVPSVLGILATVAFIYIIWRATKK